MEKLRTGVSLFACISAVTVEESIPPDRNAPSGTSETMRPVTASLSSASSRSRASPSLRSSGAACPRSATSSNDQ